MLCKTNHCFVVYMKISLNGKELEKVVNPFRFITKVWFCIADINHTHTDGIDGVNSST
ncbi:hypothetical protein AGMMS49921_06680 [Endomicrobiia bacterium]|nr:hypothetical protein AGMMS49921_06680 [Endomicrobiia bacterium]